MAKIKSIKGREILDSRGNPTVEVEVLLSNGLKAWAAVPSGVSTGAHEALEFRDKDEKRYGGKGVLIAVENVNKKITPKIIGLDPSEQEKIDKLMIGLDGTENKVKLGANAILGVSLAVARVAALDNKMPLYKYLRKKYWPKEKSWRFPKLTMNIINGGIHAGWSVDIQEFMVVPQQKNIKKAVQCGVEIFHILGDILHQKGYAITVGDEGGYAPRLAGNKKALEVIIQAIKKSGYKLGQEVKLAIDVAASEFFKSGTYEMKADKKNRTVRQMITMYDQWLKKYPIETIEDGLSEDDWDGWELLTSELGKKVGLIGDDLFVTNVSRLGRGIDSNAANAILIKLNQIGSLTETVSCIRLAQNAGYKVSVSHRSGETIDDFIADLAMASKAEYFKAGSLSRGERVAKYNRLMEIWDEMK